MFKLSSRYETAYKLMPALARDTAASAYAWWSGRRKYGGVFPQWSAFLRESQWWDGARLAEYQAQQVDGMLAFVQQASSHYRRSMEAHGVRPGTSDPLGELRKLPIINRAVVREAYDGIRTNLPVDRKLTLSTSGTTGASLHVPHTDEALQREYAFRWQFYSMGGAQRGDKFALFQGQMVVPLSVRKPPYHIRNFAERTVMFSLYHMDETAMRDYVRALERFRPDFVYGYPSGIYVLARFAQANGLKLPPVKAVFTASEMLHDFQKTEIEAAFGAAIFQWYGQVETTTNLQECDHHRIHVKEEYGLLELLDDQGKTVGPGEVGRVVATGFGNRAFPFLRYDTGDNMVLSAETKCPCGRGGRLIERIAGRDDDFVVTPEGRYVGRLDFVFKAVDTVKESQLVQEDRQTLDVLVVPDERFTERDERVIVQKLQERIGTSMRIQVRRVAEIPRSKSGKFRYVVSKVK